MGVSGGVWECGKPKRFSIISMPQSEGEKGEVTFSLRPRRGRSLAPPFPPFLSEEVFWGGNSMSRQKKEPKSENSKTVSQWGRLGRIPIDPLKTQYIWDNYYGVPQSVYYIEDNTREMTDDERADFQADRKAYRLRYVKLIADELERQRRGEKDDGSADDFGAVEGTLSGKK